MYGSFGNFKRMVRSIFSDGENLFYYGGINIFMMPNEKIDELEVISYEEEYGEDENGTPIRHFFMELKEA